MLFLPFGKNARILVSQNSAPLGVGVCHRYSRIENEKILKIIKTNLADIKGFLKAIELFLEKQKP